MDADRSPVTLFLLVLAVAGGALYLIGAMLDDFTLRMVTKPLPVLAMIAWVLREAPDRVGRVTAAALALGVCGDVLLELGGGTFLAGLVSFLLGHVAYIVAFSLGARRLAPLQAIPTLGYGAAAAGVLWTSLANMAVPVGAYMLAISAMAWRAAAFAEARRGWAWLAPLGAVLFMFSDTLIALDRFITDVTPTRGAVILTYWLGQAALSAAVVLSSSDRA